MKYLIKTRGRNKENLPEAIADFLWDSGHEVDRLNNTQLHLKNRQDYKNYDCIISILNDFDSGKSMDEIQNEIYRILHKSKNAESQLIFSDTGVYSNAIPYPHKIFSYNILNLKSLDLFFRWCRKFQIFN